MGLLINISISRGTMTLILQKGDDFTHLLRMQNTNVTGKHKVGFALRVIKGIGRRFSILVCKIAQIDLDRRAGELTEEEMNKITDIFAKPLGKLFTLLSGAFNCAISRLRNSKMVLEQTKMHQRRNLHSAFLQYGGH